MFDTQLTRFEDAAAQGILFGVDLLNFEVIPAHDVGQQKQVEVEES